MKNYRLLYPKIIIFVLFYITYLFVSSCKTENNQRIPHVYVDFTININDPMFNDLTVAGNSVVVDASYAGSASAGYDDHGIIVYRYSETEFFAFDRTCPFEEALDQAVILQNTGDITPACPKCHSKYILPSYGYPTDDSPSRYPLRRYRTAFDGQIVHVYN